MGSFIKFDPLRVGLENKLNYALGTARKTSLSISVEVGRSEHFDLESLSNVSEHLTEILADVLVFSVLENVDHSLWDG
ncbi:hypothetical protein JCM31271_27260 [Halorubrum trueperi]